MSITIKQQVREGVLVQGPKEALGFSASIALLFSENLKGALGNDPVAVFEGTEVTYGRVHPLAVLFGEPVETIVADLRVYPIGSFTLDDEEAIMDAYVSEDAEGNILLAYCPEEVRKEWTGENSMAMLAIEAADLDELLEILGTDLSGLPSAEEAE